MRTDKQEHEQATDTNTDVEVSLPPKSPEVHGPSIDAQTRCIHWHTSKDIVALQFFCCKNFYPCSLCHDEEVSKSAEKHETKRWPEETWDDKAVLCGSCKELMSVRTYIGLYEGRRATVECPACCAEFNPGCRGHLGVYFKLP